MKDLSVVIAEATRDHYPLLALKVTSGETCLCYYWTGREIPSRRVGLNGPDQLNWHRGKVASHALVELGYLDTDESRLIAEAIVHHYPTRGMRPSGPDVTCECGYYTGVEDPPQNTITGPGLGGRDRLNWHRAQVAAQALVDAGLIS